MIPAYQVLYSSAGNWEFGSLDLVMTFASVTWLCSHANTFLFEMNGHLYLSLLILLGLQLVAAQFNFFGNVFGGQHQEHQQRPGMNQWAAYSDGGMQIYDLSCI